LSIPLNGVTSFVSHITQREAGHLVQNIYMRKVLAI
jgi:hypothetical protein